ncbi:hypothetical protein [Nocardia brasiliensis]|uniref:hypothetical protein n=1 Tax=Nocardia brasiliensis TaxID=37326 RepID=UPI002B4B22A1|nr:hypothetical protein [Nocardia brasiliensis]
MHVEPEVIVYAMLGLVRLRLPLMGPFARQLGFPTGWWGRQITNGLNVFNRAVIDGSIEALAVRPGEHIADIGFGGGHGPADIARSGPRARMRVRHRPVAYDGRYGTEAVRESPRTATIAVDPGADA